MEVGSTTAMQQRLSTEQQGIELLLVPPGFHQQDGRGERVYLTILNLVRSYLTDCTLPPTFWAEAAL